MKGERRKSDIDRFIKNIRSNDMKRMRYIKYRDMYNPIISKYICLRIDNNSKIEENVKNITEFLKKLFICKGYNNIDVLEYLSTSRDTIELLGIPLNELSLKMYLFSMLYLDMEVIFNCPMLLSCYSSNEIYDAICFFREKGSEVDVEQIRLYLYNRRMEGYESERELSNIKRLMYSKQYIEITKKSLNK